MSKTRPRVLLIVFTEIFGILMNNVTFKASKLILDLRLSTLHSYTHWKRDDLAAHRRCHIESVILKAFGTSYFKKYGIYTKSFYSRQSWIFPLSNAEKKVQKLFEIVEICSNICSLRDAPLIRPFSVSVLVKKSLKNSQYFRNCSHFSGDVFFAFPSCTLIFKVRRI